MFVSPGMHSGSLINAHLPVKPVGVVQEEPFNDDTNKQRINWIKNIYFLLVIASLRNMKNFDKNPVLIRFCILPLKLTILIFSFPGLQKTRTVTSNIFILIQAMIYQKILKL